VSDGYLLALYMLHTTRWVNFS